MPLPKSFFVSEEVQARKVVLGDGQEYELHFRELPHTDFRKYFDAERSEDEDVRAGAIARLIASSVCTADGKSAMTLKDAARLRPSVANSIAEAVLDVNGLRRGNASEPEQSNGSGISSPSGSEQP